jgi:hypothetical protein
MGSDQKSKLRKCQFGELLLFLLAVLFQSQRLIEVKTAGRHLRLNASLSPFQSYLLNVNHVSQFYGKFTGDFLLACK